METILQVTADEEKQIVAGAVFGGGRFHGGAW